MINSFTKYLVLHMQMMGGHRRPEEEETFNENKTNKTDQKGGRGDQKESHRELENPVKVDCRTERWLVR